MSLARDAAVEVEKQAGAVKTLAQSAALATTMGFIGHHAVDPLERGFEKQPVLQAQAKDVAKKVRNTLTYGEAGAGALLPLAFRRKKK
jgi:hypothetical protein